MIESLINECMGMDLSSKSHPVSSENYVDGPQSESMNITTTTVATTLTTATKVKKKSSSYKTPREPKITQK